MPLAVAILSAFCVTSVKNNPKGWIPAFAGMTVHCSLFIVHCSLLIVQAAARL
jgi:hypothetical protein